jgi:hypothetical protein
MDLELLETKEEERDIKYSKWPPYLFHTYMEIYLI